MKRFVPITLVCMILSCWNAAFADDNFKMVPPADTQEAKELKLPYAFYSEYFGAAVGYVYAVVGEPQPQSAILATVMAGTKGSAMVFLMGQDMRLPGIDRLFIDPIASSGYFTGANAYVNGNPQYSGMQAGSNDSDKKDYITGYGWDNFVRANFKFLLPIGDGKDQIVKNYRLKGGLIESGASGGASWNPIESGRTFLEVRPFYRSQEVDSDYVNLEQKTNGFDFSLFWDNRDFILDPSQGNSVLMKVSRDFGWLNSSNPWTVYTGEIDKYISLGPSDVFRQRVIALDVWTAYSSSWDLQPDGTVIDRPPTFAGATLGGLFKMRGYPAARFSDKAGVYYGAEYRMIPEWNPFNNWPKLQKYVGIQWVQFVPFVEAGRVAPEWSPNTLNENMKFDGGIGLRAMAKGIVIRIDTAYSREGGSVQMDG